VTNQTGTYHWLANYSGDTNNDPAGSTCADEAVVISPNSPGLATTPSETTGAIGDTLTDSATLSGATSDAGGTIDFYLFAPGDDCSDTTTAVYSSTGVPVSGNGSYSSSSGTESGSNVTNQTGTYHWLANYSGDTNNDPAGSTCADEAVVISTPRTGQITPTATTCSQFDSGTAATLSSLQYSVKNGNVSAVNPGVFFYWIKVTATAGSNTFTINQAITTGNFDSHFFASTSGSNVYKSDCTAIKPPPSIITSGGVTTVTFNASSAGTYIIGIKYNAKSVEGFSAPSPTTVSYTFSAGGVPGSTQGLDLVKKP
jgi:hypothetical protein